MSIIGAILMWGLVVVVFVILKSWPMGKESDRRAVYWDRFEGK